MKKYGLLIPSVLGSLITIPAVVLMVMNIYDNYLFVSFGLVLLVVILLFVGFICNIIYYRRVKSRQWDTVSVAKAGFWLKILHVPVTLECCGICLIFLGYAIYFLIHMFGNGWAFIGVLGMVWIACAMFGIFVAVAIPSGVVVMAGVARAEQEGLLDFSKAYNYRIGSYIPVVDLVIAVKLLRLTKTGLL